MDRSDVTRKRRSKQSLAALEAGVPTHLATSDMYEGVVPLFAGEEVTEQVNRLEGVHLEHELKQEVARVGDAVEEVKSILERQQKKPAKLSPEEDRFWQIAQRGSKGIIFWRELENDHQRPPQTWIEKGCPRTWPAAFRDPYWRHLMEDMKSKIRRKALALTRNQ
jgi:hypothetical protein